MITGETSSSCNQFVKNVLNNPNNPKDLTVDIMLYSGAAGYGLTFKSGRMLHFLESLWDRNDYKQASDRWARINSAVYLLPKDKTFVSYRYLAVPPKSYNRVKALKEDHTAVQETADEHLLGLSKRKFMIVSRFLNWIKEGAENCTGQFAAENRIHQSIIALGKTPPMRTFFRCIQCSDKYQKSFVVQKLIGKYNCQLTGEKCGKHVVRVPIQTTDQTTDKMEGEYILDKDTGLGWLHYRKGGDKKWYDAQVRHASLLREVWKVALRKR